MMRTLKNKEKTQTFIQDDVDQICTRNLIIQDCIRMNECSIYQEKIIKPFLMFNSSCSNCFKLC
uniref:Uncharacterized protein n=1 Tax=Strigamia maritima TaxID=126957 RepID=T1JKF6_STRMM